MYYNLCSEEHNNMREWRSGGAPPCQGGGRGFDPRLALSKIIKRYLLVSLNLFFESGIGLEGSMSPLRFGPRKAEVPRTSCTVSRFDKSGFCLLNFYSKFALAIVFSFYYYCYY